MVMPPLYSMLQQDIGRGVTPTTTASAGGGSAFPHTCGHRRGVEKSHTFRQGNPNVFSFLRRRMVLARPLRPGTSPPPTSASDRGQAYRVPSDLPAPRITTELAGSASACRLRRGSSHGARKGHL